MIDDDAEVTVISPVVSASKATKSAADRSPTVPLISIGESAILAIPGAT